MNYPVVYSITLRHISAWIPAVGRISFTLCRTLIGVWKLSRNIRLARKDVRGLLESNQKESIAHSPIINRVDSYLKSNERISKYIHNHEQELKRPIYHSFQQFVGRGFHTVTLTILCSMLVLPLGLIVLVVSPASELTGALYKRWCHRAAIHSLLEFRSRLNQPIISESSQVAASKPIDYANPEKSKPEKSCLKKIKNKHLDTMNFFDEFLNRLSSQNKTPGIHLPLFPSNSYAQWASSNTTCVLTVLYIFGKAPNVFSKVKGGSDIYCTLRCLGFKSLRAYIEACPVDKHQRSHAILLDTLERACEIINNPKLYPDSYRAMSRDELLSAIYEQVREEHLYGDDKEEHQSAPQRL